MDVHTVFFFAAEGTVREQDPGRDQPAAYRHPDVGLHELPALHHVGRNETSAMRRYNSPGCVQGEFAPRVLY